jgi:hypothetical protein
MDLWHEDVFEVFLWPDERHPVYFEYEISPLNKELAILVPNFGGQFLGWRPWHYEKERLIRKATSVTGGPRQSHAAIQGWRAEFFILRVAQTAAERPKPGTPSANLIAGSDVMDAHAVVVGARTGNFHDYQFR